MLVGLSLYYVVQKETERFPDYAPFLCAGRNTPCRDALSEAALASEADVMQGCLD